MTDNSAHRQTIIMIACRLFCPCSCEILNFKYRLPNALFLIQLIFISFSVYLILHLIVDILCLRSNYLLKSGAVPSISIPAMVSCCALTTVMVKALINHRYSRRQGDVFLSCGVIDFNGDISPRCGNET